MVRAKKDVRFIGTYVLFSVHAIGSHLNQQGLPGN
jgi:hypothetical protein